MNIATQASTLVLGDRNDSYGGPAEDFKRVSETWSGLIRDKLKAPLTSQECIMMMIALKLCREIHKPKEDTRVDIIGYTLCLDWVETGKKPETTVQ